MPKNITCSQCVLQWKWRGSYNWGRCDDGYQDVGCGNQEEYYNCADIAILPSRRRRPKKPKQKPISNNWNTVMKEEIKVKTISSSKDVKTMSKDINDIKSIDKLLIQKTNQVDPTNAGGSTDPFVSGIPVYIYKPDASTTLPPLDIALVPTRVPITKQRTGIDTKPPPIFVENTPDDTNAVISKPISENIRTDFKTGKPIFDLASTNIMNGVKQDLVQSPGNNIFNKAQWIKGTTRAPGTGLINASGDGNASVQGQASILIEQSAGTNSSLNNMLNNTALNVTASDLGVLDATEDVTLNPLLINRNIKMLSDMFYGAMIATGEAELEGLLPFYHTVTQAHPFGDLANQFMESVHALNEQRKFNIAKALQGDHKSTLVQDSHTQLEKNPTQGIPVTMQQSDNLSTSNTVVLGTSGTSTVSSDVSGLTPRQQIMFTNSNSRTTTKFPENAVVNQAQPRSTSSIDSSKQSNIFGETIPPVVKPSVLFQATTNLNHQTLQHDNSAVKPTVLFQATSVTYPPSQQEERLVVTPTAPSQEVINKDVSTPQQGTRFRSFQTTTDIPTTTENPLHGVLQQMNSLLNNLNSQLDVFVHNANTVNSDIDVNKALIGSNPDQSTTQTLNTMAVMQNGASSVPTMNENNRPSSNSFKPDGVVVSNVGGVRVQHGENIYIEQPAIDIVNQMDTSWRRLSQEPTMNRIINSNNEPRTTTTLPRENTPFVISDPKSNFSFQRLTARNVEVKDLVHESNQILSKQNSITNEAVPSKTFLKQQSSDIVNPTLGVLSSDKQEHVFGQPVNYQNDVMLPELLKQVNNLDKLAKQKNLDVSDLWDAAHKILSLNSSVTQRTNRIIKPMKPTSSSKDVTILNLGQNVASKNRRASDLTNARNAQSQMSTSKRGQRLNVLDHILKKKPSNVVPNDMPPWFNSGSNFLNNGIFVIPTSPGTSQTTTTPATINTGATASMLDLMSSIWNPQQNALLGNVIV